MIICPKRYASHVTIFYSICKYCSFLEEERCDAFMYDCDVWNIMVDIMTIVHRYFHIEGYVNCRGR